MNIYHIVHITYFVWDKAILVNTVEKALSEYWPDNTQFILNGFKLRFSLHYSVPRMYRMAKQSNQSDCVKILLAINKESKKGGKVSGLFNFTPTTGLRVSPLGFVKKNSDDYRLMHHLSWPEK